MTTTIQESDTNQSKSQHLFALAKELLDDIELGRLSGEHIILKASRLARITGNARIQTWLHYELMGYGDATSTEFMAWTQRWTDYNAKKGYWWSFPQIEAAIEATEHELKALQMPNDAGAYLNKNIFDLTKKMSALRSELVALRGIRSRVMGYVHNFAAHTFYEKAFSGLAESTFEKYKMTVDAKIGERCANILQKLPYIYDRLTEGDPEAVSQALNTCRRVIDAFADSIFPPTTATIEIGGNALQLGPQNHKNRINAYIFQRELSDSRRQRLRQTLSNLYERVSAGVHNDVTPDETRALFFSTYLFLGEVLTLKEQS